MRFFFGLWWCLEFMYQRTRWKTIAGIEWKYIWTWFGYKKPFAIWCLFLCVSVLNWLTRAVFNFILFKFWTSNDYRTSGYIMHSCYDLLFICLVFDISITELYRIFCKIKIFILQTSTAQQRSRQHNWSMFNFILF